MMNSIHRYAALRKVSLRSLRAFEAALLHGSFAAAAAELCVTASAVSHAIQALERALGTPLFVREKRAIRPTEAGLHLYGVVRDSFTRINQEMQTIHDQTQDVKAVNLQCAPSLAAIWMMPRLPAFLHGHPEIDLRLSALHEPIDFHNSGMDLAIVYGRPTADPEVWVEPLDASERYVPLCSPRLMQGQRLPLPPDALSQFQLIHNETSMVSWNDWVSRYVKDSCDTAGGLRFDRSFMMINAVAQGLGMCLDSTLLARDYLRRGQVVMPFGELGIQASAHWLYVPKSKMGLPKIQAVISWIRGWRSATDSQA